MSPSKKESKTKENLKQFGWFALKTAAISGAVIGGVAVAVPAIGFTAGGVAAGSLAAAFQSSVLGGTIASGSGFAVLQSVGAAGLADSTKAAIVGVSATIAGAHTKLRNKKNDGKPDPPHDNSTFPVQVSNDEKSDTPPSNSSVPLKVSNDEKSEDLKEEEAEQEDTDKNADKVMKKEPKINNDVQSFIIEANDNLINEKKIWKENTTVKNISSRKGNSISGNKKVIDSVESKWNDVELTDDISILKSIAKRIK